MSTTTTTTEPSPPLDYAPPNGGRGKRVRRVAMVVVLVSLVAAGWVWRDWIRLHVNQAALLHAQRQCLRYDPPASQVVYEEDSNRARELLKSKDHRPGSRPHAPEQVIALRDTTLLDPIYRRATWAVPPVRGALLFMHERFNENGERFLLVVHAWVADEDRRNNPEGRLRFHLQEIPPATWSRGLGGGNGLNTPIMGLDEACRGKRLRMYAGQPDPNDPRHFTIRYEIDGVEGFLDGWVGERKEGSDGVPIPGLRIEMRRPK